MAKEGDRALRVRRWWRRCFSAVAVLATVSGLADSAAAETWRGLAVVPERRCAPYDSRDYAYSKSMEARIVGDLGMVRSPYTERCFASTRDTDIEHIVARSEAHDSGLCAADAITRRRFSSDLLNLTLASPMVNRGQKIDHDAAGWLPPRNQCWFAERVIEVRRKYGLTIDRREADALERVLASCSSTLMSVGSCANGFEIADVPAASNSVDVLASSPLQRWDDNGNGRITCAEARRHGLAPVPRSHPAYPFMHDGDSDGVVCE